jgi:hypothetical protein
VAFELEDRLLRADDAEVRLPLLDVRTPWEGDLLNLRHAFPSRAHGDEREKQIFKIVQDASPEPLPDKLDEELRQRLAEHLPLADEVDRHVLAEAMHDEYWVTPKLRPTLLPYHSSLATAFQHSTPDRRRPFPFKAARYKLFRGLILLFLCWDGARVRDDLVADLLEVLNGTEGFTLLDQLMIEAARVEAGEPPLATAQGLLQRREAAGKPTFAEVIEASLSAGAFCQPHLDLFQRDLETVLRMRGRVPRRDFLDELTALLSLHLGIYYYRVATVLGEELDRAIAATGGFDDPSQGCDCSGGLRACALAGRIRFRVGTRGDRPVKTTHGCATSYRDVDDQYLFPLSVNIITANLAQAIFAALGGEGGEPQLRAIALRARADAEFSARFNALASGVAFVHAMETGVADHPESGVALSLREPGLFALRESVMASRRGRLKYISRDVVNQLMARDIGGSLLRTRGSVKFFELDEDFLFLLVKLVCQESARPFDAFLDALRDYGLSPQDAAEQDELAAALERLGILKRYSDAGESAYVQYPL